MHQLPSILQLDLSSAGEEMASLLQGPGPDEYYQVRVAQDHLARARDLLALLKRRGLDKTYREKYSIKHLSHATILRHAALLGLELPKGSAVLNFSPITSRHILRKSAISLAIDLGLGRIEAELLSVPPVESSD